MSSINKYSLKEPDVDLMIIENGSIENNIITIDKKNSAALFLPSMYESWTEDQKVYINFKIEENFSNNLNNNDILYIFDTFGISSYYHLLIDTIIPLWITKTIVQEYIKTPITNSYFLQISNNNYKDELSNSNDIFKYFLKNSYTTNISGNFRYIVYGYSYRYRPFFGPTYDNRYFPKYKFMIDRFCDTFSKSDNEKDYILMPQRTTRSYEHIDKLYDDLSKTFNVKMLDFGDYSIEEQINMCSKAWAMIGCEGAAFANQIFMKKGSLIICLGGNDAFQSPIASYIEHTFFHIHLTLTYDELFKNISKILTPYLPFSYKRLT